MAATVSVDTWNKNVSKRPTVMNLLNSKVKVFTAKITFGSSDTYTTGGVEVDVRGGKCKTILLAIPTHSSIESAIPKLELKSDSTAVKVYYTTGSAELANASAAIKSATLEVLVFGV